MSEFLRNGKLSSVIENANDRRELCKGMPGSDCRDQ